MDILSLLHLPVGTLVFYALPFLVALTVIVFIHELGHHFGWSDEEIDLALGDDGH